MFSPDLQNGAGQASTRNPRRRQRGENDSVSVKQPQRKRSKLSQQIFTPTNGVASPDGGSGGQDTPVNGTLKGTSRRTHGSVDLTVREKKNSAATGSKRGGRPDTSTVLTRTSNYAFKQLPSFPERLKTGGETDYHVYTQPGSTYALALTRTQAIIWDYTTAFANPTPRVFTYPEPFKPTDPLPQGTLVTSRSSTDLGLVLVGAKNGKVTYWENIEFADSAALFQQRQAGVDGYIKLVSGETVVELVDAHHAGYLLRLSGGRLAHFSIRDQQGRAAITVALLEGQKPSGWGLRNIFQGSWQKRDLAAVKARQASRKSYIDVTAVTRDATITEWDISWEGKQNWRRESSVAGVLREALQNDESIYLQQDETFHVLDFVQLAAPLAQGEDSVVQAGVEIRSLLLFVVTQQKTERRFALIELLVLDDQINEGNVFPVSSYKAQSPRGIEDLHAKLLLPEPEHTALVVMEDQLLIVGLASDTSFQDALPLKSGPAFEIIGGSCELTGQVGGGSGAKSRTATCLLASKTTGIVRVSLEKSGIKDRPLPRTKFEQAIYFGQLPDTFLRLGARPAYPYAAEDVEQALVSVSHAVLESASEYLPSTTPSTRDQIEFRARRLRDLSQFIVRNYPEMSREVKWRVLWDAEKIEALSQIRQAYETLLATKDAAHPPLLPVILERTQQKGLIRSQTKSESKDPLLQWFFTDARSIEKVVPWTYEGLQDIYRENVLSMTELFNYIRQGDELALLAVSSALKFRQAHAAEFGLGDEHLEHGLLISGYEGLPELWTSRLNVVNGVRQLTDFSRALTIFSQDGEPNEQLVELAKIVAEENVDLVDLSCRTHIERTRWLLNHGSDEAAIKAGERWETEFTRDIRPNLITGLTSLGQAPAGMVLAERFDDLASLAVITLDELRYHDPQAEDAQQLSSEERATSKERYEVLKAQVRQYFEKYGAKWANIFYGKAIEQHRYAELLDKGYGQEAVLTKYLHARPARAGLAWINDISNDNDLVDGATSLLTAATETETNAWCQNVELSLTKLTLLASLNKNGTSQNGNALKGEQLVKETDQRLQLSRLQQRLYNHIKREASVAISQDQVADLLMQTYAPDLSAERPALGELLKRGFDELASHRVMDPALLIDVLTLMESVACDVKADDISGKEFLMALQVLDASGLADDDARKDEFEGLARLIWKRCFVRDDWLTLVTAVEGKADSEITSVLSSTAAFTTLKEGNLLALWKTTPAFQPLSPSTAIHALSTAADLTPRFGETLAPSIAADNAADDDLLQSYITDASLDTWSTSLQKLASQAALDDNPIARDVAERKALLEFIKSGFKEPDFAPMAEARMSRSAALAGRGSNGFEDGDGFEDDDVDQDEGYEEGYEGGEELRSEGETGEDIDDDGDVEMG